MMQLFYCVIEHGGDDDDDDCDDIVMPLLHDFMISINPALI